MAGCPRAETGCGHDEFSRGLVRTTTEEHVMRTLTRIGGIAAVATVAAGTALPPLPALAQGGATVTRAGTCSGASHWNMNASRDNGRIEVESEIHSNKAGQTWNWRLVHNGSV